MTGNPLSHSTTLRCFIGGLLLSFSLGTGNGAGEVRAADALVQVDTFQTIGRLSPLVYGVSVSVPAEESLLAEAASHGIRLIHIDARRMRCSSENFPTIIQMLRWARAHGLVPVVSLPSGDDVGTDAACATSLLEKVHAEGLSLPWMRLTPCVSKAILANVSSDGVVRDEFSRWRSFAATTFLVDVSGVGGYDEKAPRPDWFEVAMALVEKNNAAVSPFRLGLAIESDATSTDAHPATLTGIRQGTSTPVFRLLNWTTESREPDIPDMTRLVRKLTAASQVTDALRAVILPDAESENQSGIGTVQLDSSFAVAPHIWLPFMGVIKVLSDWGNVHGLEVLSSSRAPLYSCATKSFGQFSTCLVNEDAEECIALVKVRAPVGVYGVRSRLLVEDERYLRPEKSLGAMKVAPGKPTAEIHVRLPRKSVLVLRGCDDALLAYRSCRGLYQCAKDCRQTPFARQGWPKMAGILEQVVRSARASMNRSLQNPLAAAYSAHNALLRLAQVEAMLNNSAMQGNLPRVDFADMITLLEQSMEHLSHVSAQALGVNFEVVCSERVARPGESFMCQLRVANHGTQTLRNVRFFCENDDPLIVKPLQQSVVRSLTPGQSTTITYSCKLRKEGASRGFHHLAFGVWYSFRQGFAELRREVDVAVL